MQGWISYILWKDDSFINGKPRVECPQSHFYESVILMQQYSKIVVIVVDGIQFIHGDDIILNGNPKLYTRKVTFQTAKYSYRSLVRQ